MPETGNLPSYTGLGDMVRLLAPGLRPSRSVYCRSVLRLAGDQILLRDFLPQDREPFLALEADEAMFTYMKFRIDRDSAESVSLPRLLQEPDLDPRPSYNLVVEDTEGFCGWAGIDSIEGTDSGQLGWYLRSDRWGRGYATEATRLLLDFGFPVLQRATMWATADPDNLASIRVLEKSGLTRQGLTNPVDTWRGTRPRVLFTIEAEHWRTRQRPPQPSDAG
jgi:ribosomal-protein-alanine N-acetyltransferase